MLERIIVGAFFGALTLGLTGFAIGFFGPMIFMPGANQGPLIGIFVTGPLGTLAGACAGAFIGWRRGSRQPSQ